MTWMEPTWMGPLLIHAGSPEHSKCPRVVDESHFHMALRSKLPLRCIVGCSHSNESHNSSPRACLNSSSLAKTLHFPTFEEVFSTDAGYRNHRMD